MDNSDVPPPYEPLEHHGGHRQSLRHQVNNNHANVREGRDIPAARQVKDAASILRTSLLSLALLSGLFIAISVSVVMWQLSDLYGYKPLLSARPEITDSPRITAEMVAATHNFTILREFMVRAHGDYQMIIDATIPNQKSFASCDILHSRALSRMDRLLAFNNSLDAAQKNLTSVAQSIISSIEEFSESMDLSQGAYSTIQLTFHGFWSKYIPFWFSLGPMALLGREIQALSTQHQHTLLDVSTFEIRNAPWGHIEWTFSDNGRGRVARLTFGFLISRYDLPVLHCDLQHSVSRSFDLISEQYSAAQADPRLVIDSRPHLEYAARELKSHYQTIYDMLRKGRLAGQSFRDHLEEIQEHLLRTKFILNDSMNKEKNV